MAKLIETDERVTFSKQIEEDSSGPVIEIIKFTVDPEDVNKFLKASESDAEYFKRQPGFISAQLHRGVGGSRVFIIYTVWGSSAQLKKALSNIDLKVLLKDYPPTTVVSPLNYVSIVLDSVVIHNLAIIIFLGGENES